MIIEIHSTLQGKNPLWVREAWVGLQLPSLDEIPIKVPVADVGNRPSFGALFRSLKDGSADPIKERFGYSVNAKIAVGIVSFTNEDAARWWLENVPQMMRQDMPLLFETACCRPV
jgi:hypothetical protein